MTTDHTALNTITGPELLDQMADVEESRGSPVNAAHNRERALQWAQLERRVADLEAENSELTHRLQRIRDTAQAA